MLLVESYAIIFYGKIQFIPFFDIKIVKKNYCWIYLQVTPLRIYIVDIGPPQEFP